MQRRDQQRPATGGDEAAVVRQVGNVGGEVGVQHPQRIRGHGQDRGAADPELVRDTTVYLARDAAGHFASGASTSGWAWKYPGRLGDTPVIGAGSYADTRFGAAACTHTGEMTIRAGTARAIVLSLQLGMPLQEAVDRAVADLRDLRGGQLGAVVIHALDCAGGHRVVALNTASPIHYWLWLPGMPAPERRIAAAA